MLIARTHEDAACLHENRFRPKVFAKGAFTVKIGQPDSDFWQTLSGIKSESLMNAKVINVKLEK